MPDNRPNLQVKQPTIQGYGPDDQNGWPNPLTDPSSPLKVAVTNGSNGSQRNFDPVATQGQDQLSLAEGHSKLSLPGDVWGHEKAPTGLSVSANTSEPFQTSANIRGEISSPESA